MNIIRFCRPILLVLVMIVSQSITSQELEKKYKDNSTYLYDELINAYEVLSQKSTNAQLISYGKTDSGKQLKLFVWSQEPLNDLNSLPKDKTVILINNAIHAGESCGVDASLHFAEQLIGKDVSYPNVILCIIPAYNLGGMLNRGCCTRANQNGPIDKGFRGNAQNLDLNRDFIKADALNTRSFFSIFQTWKPHIFIDTHSTNGADYPAELTLIFSQPNQYYGNLKGYSISFNNKVFDSLTSKGILVSEFVNIYGKTPDKGFPAFKETPIYSTGYTSSYGTLSIVSEAHMLKDYEKRVEATYSLIQSTMEIANSDNDLILKLKAEHDSLNLLRQYHTIKRNVDSTSKTLLEFNGYDYSYEKSKISGRDRLLYHRDMPVEWNIDYYPYYKSIDSVQIPKYYAVSKAWWRVEEILRSNSIEYIEIKDDSIVNIEGYRILDYNTSKRAYEGHYIHSDVDVSIHEEAIILDDNFILVPTEQFGRSFIINTLEPEAEGSLFSWNFFDPILQQKEWYSSYVFEDTAFELLENNADLKDQFEKAKNDDPQLNSNGKAQLHWIYMHSDYYERTHMRYPVYRILD